MPKTNADNLLNVLYHLRNARKALLRTDWSSDRDVILAEMDRTYRRVHKTYLATDQAKQFAAKQAARASELTR